jgi:hypothetical protein
VIIRILHFRLYANDICFFAIIIHTIDNDIKFYSNLLEKVSRYRNYIIIKITIFICSALIEKNKSTLEQMSEKSDYKIVIFKIN